MFHDHPAADKYSCSSMKSAYLLWYKSAYLLWYIISEVLEAEQIQSIKDVPYTFKFDETTSTQVFKQYNGYFYDWSPMYDEVVNTYAGFLFMGHCTAVDLVMHFYEMVQPHGLKGVNLLHLGMDGSQVNTKFEKELQASFHVKEGTSIFLLGICSLHPVYTAFKNGFQKKTSYLKLSLTTWASSSSYQPHNQEFYWSWCCYRNSCWICKVVWSYMVPVSETSMISIQKLEFMLFYPYAKCEFRLSIRLHYA